MSETQDTTTVYEGHNVVIGIDTHEAKRRGLTSEQIMREVHEVLVLNQITAKVIGTDGSLLLVGTKSVTSQNELANWLRKNLPTVASVGTVSYGDSIKDLPPLRIDGPPMSSDALLMMGNTSPVPESKVGML